MCRRPDDAAGDGPLSLVYLYALLGDSPGARPGRGLAGERVRTIACGDILAAVGELSAVPPLDAAALRGHDAVVRRLAGLVSAILPARFGSTASDEVEIAAAIALREGHLRSALALVRGGEQMTLRVYAEDPAGARRREADASPPERKDRDNGGGAAGPGTRYLTGRLRVMRAAREIPELAPLSREVGGLVRATRVRRHATAPLVATVYHLIGRGESPAYLAAVYAARDALGARTAAVHRPVRVVASGPWPPYAFADGAEP